MKKHKLDHYHLAAITFLSMGSSLHSQVVYTNIDPDRVLELNSTAEFESYIDLNNDGELDFLFNGFTSDNTQNEIGIFGVNNYLVSYSNISNDKSWIGKIDMPCSFGTYLIGLPYALESNVNINSIGPWSNNTNSSTYVYNFLGIYVNTEGTAPAVQCGNWNSQNDKYLDLRINIDGNSIYGWVRLSVSPAADTLIIKDYAYNTTPNVGLKTGEGIPATSISNFNDPFNIKYSGNSLLVTFVQNNNNVDLEIININGQSILKSILNSDQTLIDLTNYPSGFYLITVKIEGEVYSKSFVHN